jgi:hypothetical protein
MPGAQLVRGHDEVDRGEDGREADHEHADDHGEHVSVRELRAEGRVERPAGVDAAGDQRIEGERAAEGEHVPAGEVQSGKGEIPRAEHQRDREIAERGRDRGDQEEPHHDHAIQRERLVAAVMGQEIARRGDQLEAHQPRRHAADEEEQGDGHEIQERDPLVIGGQQPRADGVALAQIAPARQVAGDRAHDR